MEGRPDCETLEVVIMKYQFVYLNVVIVCLNELDSICLDGRAGQGKNLPGGSLKYLSLYLKVRIFKCTYRVYIYISNRSCSFEKHPPQIISRKHTWIFLVTSRGCTMHPGSYNYKCDIWSTLANALSGFYDFFWMTTFKNLGYPGA